MRQTSTIKMTAAKPITTKSRLEASFGQTKSNGNFNQKVAEKAYELYVARGCAHGYDVEDWIKAEKIVKG